VRRPKPGLNLRGRRLLWQLFQCLGLAVLGVASYLFVSHFLLQSVCVRGGSMQPTLRNAEHYLLNRWMYYVRSPRRGDIVVIRDPADNGLSVKRIVALEGESLCLRNGLVYLNDKKLDEAYLPRGTKTFPDGALHEQRLQCRKGQYIVLGDNRGNSTDSRAYGPVPRAKILGLIIR
jgi:signal peptidase I